MAPSPPLAGQRLPRGRSALPPEEVRRIHRQRLCLALASEMAEKGYAGTSVEDVLKRAGVSRRAFYELFDSKLDCFLAAFEYASRMLTRRVLEAVGIAAEGPAGAARDPMDMFEIAISAYLSALAEELPSARLFVVESHAAGLKAIERRAQLQAPMADELARLLGVTGPSGRYSCVMFVAAVSSLVTVPVAAGDRDGIRALGPPLIRHVRELWRAGAFSEPAGPAPDRA